MNEELIKRLLEQADQCFNGSPSAKLLREAADALSAPSHSERAVPVAGVDVEKVMALVDEYAVLLRREFTATIGSVRRFREGEAEEKRSEIRAIIASAPAVPVGDGWLPIETAPKDGTAVLLRNKKLRIADGYWMEANSTCGAWIWPYVKSEPTHWQPLPPAPSVDGEG